MKAIIVTGSVGSGKTTLSKKFARFCKYKYVDVSKIAKKIADSYDKENKCFIIDEEKLNKELIKLIKSSKKKLVIDSHMAHYLPKKYVKFCIVTKCNIKELGKRLKKRGYGKSKIRDNVEAEIFNVCLEESKEYGHKTIAVDTSYKLNKEVLKLIIHSSS